ncbi:MAG TPA: S8 family serine peptidase [Roseiflexaceae bacterium]|nr:S8 family serine peptidase [Roseiflexaceae bacterium]
MGHPPPRRSRTRLRLLALALVCLAALPHTSPAAAQATVSADPPALAVSLPLGEQASRTIRLTGPGGFSPTIYEAQATPPKALPAGPKRAPLPAQKERVEAAIAAQAAAAPDGRAEFMVVLRDQADLSAAYAIRDWAERGRYVYRTLSEHAARSQAGLRAQLEARGLRYRPLWIINALLVRGAPADAAALAGRADVALLRAQRSMALPRDAILQSASVSERCSPDAPGNPVCWNIRRIGADRVWREFGVDGRGVTVANIDTGVTFGHAALLGGYRGNRGGQLDHSYNWFDPQGSHPAPTDGNGHGTHTMATIAGRGDGTLERPAIGVAPGASWVAAQGCEDFLCSEFDLIAAAQWLLAPTDLAGERPRPDLRAMVVNNSWGGLGGSDWYSGYTAAWRAAGMFPLFAAGNVDASRPQTCGSIASPADYADVMAVGATDAADTVASFSLLGPAQDGRMKPDISAPGTHTTGQAGVLSASNAADSEYRALQGTSMAAPHVAGVVALLWSANPALIGDYDATYGILRDTALRVSDTRCGDAPGAPNNVYGHGRVDAHAAVARARVDVPWLLVADSAPAVAPDGSASVTVTLAADRVPGPGTYTARLQVFGDDLGHAPTSIEITMTVAPIDAPAVVTGRVVSADTGAPLAATVGVAGGLGVPTAGDGTYLLTLKPGSYTLAASALSYVPGSLAVTAAAGATTVRDIALAPDQARIAIGAPPIAADLAFAEERRVTVTLSNPGRRPLYYSATVPQDQFSVWRSDSSAPGAPVYRWVELPPDAPALTLQEDGFAEKVPLRIPFPFYSYVLTETLVTADGMLAFDTPYGYHGPATRCFPADELGFYTIAPLRADLSPDRAGTVRYGTLDGGRTFVLSYEGVPRDGGPLEETYTFQVLLHIDGRIVFQYRALGPPTPAMSAGVQRTPWDYQEIGCGAALRLADRLAIELRPQVPARAWLAVTPAEGTILPGQQATLQLTLSWERPNVPGPYRTHVRIASNDPLSPTTLLPVELTARPAPYEQLLPTVFRQQ